MSFAGHLNKRLQIKRRPGTAVDAQGHPTGAHTAVATYRGRIVVKSQKEWINGEQGVVTVTRGLLAFGADVVETDQCVDLDETKTYEVGPIHNPGGMKHHLEIELTKVE